MVAMAIPTPNTTGLSADERIAALIETDRRLVLVGNGTLGMVLAAAEKAGFIPQRSSSTEYGIATAADPDIVITLASLEGAHDYVRDLDRSNPGHGYRPVHREHTHYRNTVTAWSPVTEETP